MRGATTVEAAFAIAALVVVLVLCAAGLTALSMQVRCIDAAREAARLAARGDDGDPHCRPPQNIAPHGAGAATASRRRVGGRDGHRAFDAVAGRHNPRRHGGRDRAGVR